MAETRYGYDTHQSNNSGLGQVGKDEVLIITITYWVDLEKAREMQKQAIAEDSKKLDKDKNKYLAVEEAWFSISKKLHKIKDMYVSYILYKCIANNYNTNSTFYLLNMMG